MIQFSAPVSSVRFRLNTFIVVREDFIINACKAERIPWRKITIDEQSSFINYEFYHLLNQNSLITPDDIIIAERYYEDKEIEDSKFAYGNATYLFKIKDLVRILNKNNNNKILKLK
jgi:hypothetical protein